MIDCCRNEMDCTLIDIAHIQQDRNKYYGTVDLVFDG